MESLIDLLGDEWGCLESSMEDNSGGDEVTGLIGKGGVTGLIGGGGVTGSIGRIEWCNRFNRKEWHVMTL